MINDSPIEKRLSLLKVASFFQILIGIFGIIYSIIEISEEDNSVYKGMSGKTNMISLVEKSISDTGLFVILIFNSIFGILGLIGLYGVAKQKLVIIAVYTSITSIGSLCLLIYYVILFMQEEFQYIAYILIPVSGVIIGGYGLYVLDKIWTKPGGSSEIPLQESLIQNISI